MVNIYCCTRLPIVDENMIWYWIAAHCKSSVIHQITLLLISPVCLFVLICSLLFCPDWQMKSRHSPDAPERFNDYQLSDSVLLLQPNNRYVYISVSCESSSKFIRTSESLWLHWNVPQSPLNDVVLVVFKMC